jgi:putative ABC transport system permease protein
MERFLDQFWNWENLTATVITATVLSMCGLYIAMRPKMFLLVTKNLRRNILRTLLISLAIMVLVAKVTLIWTIIYVLGQVTEEKSKNFKLIITERWQFPSQMPMTHADYLNPDNSKFLPDLKGLYGPNDFMTWSFYGGTTDPTKMSYEFFVFFFVMRPEHIRTMMDDLDQLDPALVKKMQETRNGCLLGKTRLEKLNKRIGERFKITSVTAKGIDLDFEILGELPGKAYDLSGIMNADYLQGELDRYARVEKKQHVIAEKPLALIWLRVPNRATFDKVGETIENSPYFSDHPVRVESASSGIGNFLDGYRGLISMMKYLLAPTILVVMALVVANAISISVRERRPEIAVMKVLGYPPREILNLVVGEALLIGAVSGFLSAFLAVAIVNWGFGGFPFQIAFFPGFGIPYWALVWGPAMGSLTALAGSFVPAWTARSVRVSEVFAKVT